MIAISAARFLTISGEGVPMPSECEMIFAEAGRIELITICKTVPGFSKCELAWFRLVVFPE